MPSLLEREVAAFNEGVRTGDWAPLVALFAEDAVLEFDGIPVGPFRGRDAIAEAYRTMPPDDEIVLLDGGPHYAWSKEPDRPAGELQLEETGGRIVRLRVLYGHTEPSSNSSLGNVLAAILLAVFVVLKMRRRRT